MKEYPVKFGTNVLNKYGNWNNESDIASTINCSISKNGNIDVDRGMDLKTFSTETDVEGLDDDFSRFTILKTARGEFGIFAIYQILPISGSSIKMGIAFIRNSGQIIRKIYEFETVTTGNIKKFLGSSLFFSGEFFYAAMGASVPNFLNSNHSKYVKITNTFNPTVEEIVLPTDPDLILNRVTPHYSYFFGTSVNNDGHVLYYSAPEFPENWDDAFLTNFIVVGNNDEQIIDMVSHAGNLYIFKERSVWLLTGGAPEQFQLIELINDYGLKCSFGYTIKNNILYFITDTFDLYSISGNSFEKIIDSDEFKAVSDLRIESSPFDEDKILEPLFNDRPSSSEINQRLYDVILTPSTDNLFYISFITNLNFEFNVNSQEPYTFSFDINLKSLSKNELNFLNKKDNNLNGIAKLRGIVIDDIDTREYYYYQFYNPTGGFPNTLNQTEQFMTEKNMVELFYQHFRHVPISDLNVDFDVFNVENIIVTKRLLNDGIEKKLRNIKISGIFNTCDVYIFSDYSDLEYQNEEHKLDVKYDKTFLTGKFKKLTVTREDYTRNFTAGMRAIDFNETLRLQPIIGKYFLLVLVMYPAKLLSHFNNKPETFTSNTRPNIREISLVYEELPQRRKRF